MPEKLRMVLWFLLAIVLVIGAIAFVTYEEQKATVKYQRECYSALTKMGASVSAEEKQARAEQCKDPKQYMPWWYVLVAWPEGITVWAIVLTLAAIAYQAREMTRATSVMDNQLIHMRESSERELRAYVLPELGNIVNVAAPVRTSGSYTPTEARVTHPDWGPVIAMQIKNTGQTPAFKVVHWGNTLFREYPLKSDLPGPDEGMAKITSVIGPGIVNTKRLAVPKPLTEKEIAQLRESTGAIYVYGYISYEDTFGKKHLTRYRLFHNQGSGAVGISTDLTFAEGGNEAD